MTDSQEITLEELEEGPITPRRMGLFAGAADVILFAYLGHVLFEDPLFGAVVGLLVGGGVALFLPIFVRSSAVGGLEEMAPANSRPFRSFHRLAAGLVLSGAGILLLATRFAELDPLVSGAGVLAVAGLAYVALAVALPNARPE